LPFTSNGSFARAGGKFSGENFDHAVNTRIFIGSIDWHGRCSRARQTNQLPFQRTKQKGENK
jgi:hypothetical protein